jgi:hypothetical protein
MSVTFKFFDQDEYLRVISKGICEDLNQLKEYVLAIHNAVLTSGHVRVLVDETRLEYKLSTINSYNSGRFISQLTPKPQRIAVLCKADGWEDARFWETVAVNRGVPVQVFRDHDSAENWLLG